MTTTAISSSAINCPWRDVPIIPRDAADAEHERRVRAEAAGRAWEGRHWRRAEET